MKKLYFFSRNKSELNAPIRTSFDNLIRYHLGTVAIGSLFIAIIQMLRVLLKVVEVIEIHHSVYNTCYYMHYKRIKEISIERRTTHELMVISQTDVVLQHVNAVWAVAKVVCNTLIEMHTLKLVKQAFHPFCYMFFVSSQT